MTLIDRSSEFGTRVVRHLVEDDIVWMTTVSASGAPVPSPVWFLWDGDETVTMHSLPGARVRNIEGNPRVALHFDGNGQGGDIVVLSGRAQAAPELPAADADPKYLAKYAGHISRIGMTPRTFATTYSVPVRVKLNALRGH